MACDGCDDFAYAWHDLDHSVTGLAWGLIGLWCLLALLIWALIGKGVIAWTDLLPKVVAAGE